MPPEIRSATDADIDAICAIVADALEPEDADEARLVLEDPSFDRDRWLVGSIDGQVMSTLALFDSVLRVGAATLPAGQIEFVATSERARGQGLIRAQLDEAHRRSAAAGHIAVFIVGIPHFYRQFGYSYAVQQPPYIVVPESAPLDPGAGWEVRTATEADLPAIAMAQESLQAEASVALTHTQDMWRWLLASPNYEIVVAEARGQLGAGRIYEDGDTAWLTDVVAPAKGALHALIDRARAVQPEVMVVHRSAGLLSAMLDDVGEVDDELGWFFVRIEDAVALLNGLRPELDARLSRSGLAGFSGTFTLSQYTSSATCEIAAGVTGPFRLGEAIPYPVSAGASGVPPDRIADLVLGPHGAGQLERLHGDVLLGEQRELMEVLFPPLVADIQTWVIP